MRHQFRGLLFLSSPVLFLAGTALSQSSHPGAPAASLTTFRPAPPQVWIVDAGGRGQFTEIQPAVDTASDGDFVLVRAGTYSFFTLDGRSLTITADDGALVTVHGGCSVQNLPSSSRVLLAGLDLSAAVSAGGGLFTGLSATNGHGSLRVERCALHGYDNPSSDGFAGLSANNCWDLVLSDCSASGGAPQSTGTYGHEGGAGLTALNVNLAMYRTTCTGADAAAGYLQGGLGGDGGLFSVGQAFASDCFFKAGAGGSNDDCVYGYGGDAGQPVRQQGGLVLQSLDCLILGAPGGTHPCGSPGNDSYPLWTPGPFSTLAGSARSLASSMNPIREGQTLALTLTGEPGESAFLVFSVHNAHSFDADLHGVVLAGQPYFLHPMIGTIPASGSLTYTLPLGTTLAASGSAVRWYVQGVTQNGAGDLFLTNPVDLVVLDSSL